MSPGRCKTHNTVYIPATKNESITNRKAMHGTALHRTERCSLGPHIRIQQPTSAGPPKVILSMLQVYTLKFSDPNWVVVPLKTNPHSLPFRTKTSLTLTTVDRGVLPPSSPPLEELASESSIRNSFVCVAITHDVIFNSAAKSALSPAGAWNDNPTESGRIDYTYTYLQAQYWVCVWRKGSFSRVSTWTSANVLSE